MTRIAGFKTNNLTQPNKYGAVRTEVVMIGRTFDSKAEAARARDLWLLQRAGVISKLEFQVPYELSAKPKITITIDFRYVEDGVTYLEDVKGVLTRDFRTKLAWLKEKYGLVVKLVGKE